MLDGTIEVEDRDKYLEVVLSETKRMSALITDLLNLAKIESGQFPIELSEFDINELIRRCIIMFEQRIEEKNLNRILNATIEDARCDRLKVDVLRDAIVRMGLETNVIALGERLNTRAAVCAVADCDVVFGCMDGVEGRHLLNRLAVFYSLPYFDMGVRLEADGQGGIDQVSSGVHYLQPDRSSLLSRGVISLERLRAEEMHRIDPTGYREQLRVGYLRGVPEERPAVISVNAMTAAVAVNEFLARLHPYRLDPNGDFATVFVSLTQGSMHRESDDGECSALAPHVGRGDVEPLLDRPELSADTCRV
jgi:hypothetical protein